VASKRTQNTSSAHPPALRSGYRTRRPPPAVLEPHRQAVESGTLEDALALDRLIVARISGWLDEREWSNRGRRLRPEVERLERAASRSRDRPSGNRSPGEG
jgi:hypothetical protein